MTRAANARLAGFSLLFYIAVAVPQMMLSGRATAGGDMAARLATAATHATELRIVALLSLTTCFVAIALGAALYGLTRAVDHDLAAFALACRVGEGLGAAFPVVSLGFLWLASGTGQAALDPATANSTAALLLKLGAWKTAGGATLFAVGSTVFCWLLLRGRVIPVSLAWLGVAASVLLVGGLPLQLVGWLSGPATGLMWVPMAAFEIPLGIWLLVTGAPITARRPVE
jgi:hypothetical protein